MLNLTKDFIFVTGIYGSGKTTLALKISKLSTEHEYLSFDEMVDYGLRQCNCSIILKKIESLKKVVIDAIPLSISFNNGPKCNWDMFTSWENVNYNKIQIICTCCPRDIWINRLKKRSSLPSFENLEGYKNINEIGIIEKHFNSMEHYYYTHYIKLMEKFKSYDKIVFYNSNEDKYITKEEMYKVIQK